MISLISFRLWMLRYCILTVLMTILFFVLLCTLTGKTDTGMTENTVNSTTFEQMHFQWPPRSLQSIRNPYSGLWDLTLRPKVDRSATRSSDFYYDTLKSMHMGSEIKGSRLKTLVFMDRDLRVGGSHPDYRLYPQTIDMRETVRAIRAGQPVPEEPINNPELFVINPSKTTCSYSAPPVDGTISEYPLDLVVVLKSCPGCFDRRAHARSTYMHTHLWKGLRVQFVFILGVLNEQIFVDSPFRRDKISKEHGLITTAFQIKKINQDVYEESSVHGDLVIGSFMDTYENLTIKRIFTFRWVSAFCRDQSPLFLFIDDDISLIPANVIKLVQKIPREARKFFNGGFPDSDLLVHRLGAGYDRWSVSEDEFPWSEYPPYSYGAGNLLGVDMVCEASIAMAFTQFYKLEDVFSGIVWKKLDYPLLGIAGFRLYITSYKMANDTILAFTNYVDKYINWKTGAIPE